MEISSNLLSRYVENPFPITVAELCNQKFDFVIPSYQRGYRWTEKEVVRLLIDLLSYNKAKDGNFYCLQPLVVRHIQVGKHHHWRVIDGQQRLTSIFLILHYLGYKNGGYSLEYERDNVLSRVLTDTQFFDPDETCEVYHLSSALKAIDSFFKKIPESENQKKLLLKNILENCSFILYVMRDNDIKNHDILDDMEHDLFNNLNSGKISLTESELIKALLLHNIGEDKFVKEIKQVSMAEELDNMERVLREDEMWYFLAGDRQKPSSCIDYLYKVWYLATYEQIPNDIDYPIFSILEDDITSDIIMLEKWKEIKKCFYTITGWYSDPLLYNLIGYLEGRKIPRNHREGYPPYNEELIAKLYRYSSLKEEENKLPTKHELLKYIKGLCRDSIPSNYLELRFDTDKNAVFNLLLLLNVAMMINHKSQNKTGKNEKSSGKGNNTSIGRFPFHVFHSLNWNVEHISPQNPKDKSKLYNSLCELKQEYDNILPKEVEALFNKLDTNKDNLESLNSDPEFISLSKELIADKQDVMLLRNLTLLTEHDNKGIGNKFYFDKRNKLNEYQSQGSFIPASTLNVFSKWHTENPDGYILWGTKDQEAYLLAIKNTISDFIKYCDHVTE